MARNFVSVLENTMKTAFLIRINEYPEGIPYCESCIVSASDIPEWPFHGEDISTYEPEPGDICDCCNDPLTSDEEFINYWNSLAEKYQVDDLKYASHNLH